MRWKGVHKWRLMDELEKSKFA
uniref:Uncharacterized protein n=1 Tax=Anguilla anguilla TaxID=7936 RepID=A0A0E9SF86_ANGAN